ncbi:MAG: hypothetical protein E7619_09175 [Ruminococcaceae bacterium]|nr:hypothetical protein [Oscillospiraceae bacterium]
MTMKETVLFEKLIIQAPKIKYKNGKDITLDETARSFEVAEEISYPYADTACVRRTFRYLGSEPCEVQVILDVKALYAPERFTVPSVSYNGNKRSDGKEPHGWELNGVPWTYSSDRVSVPACTVFENRDTVTALFASELSKDNLICAASVIFAENDKRHRIIWPDSDMPLEYTDHDVLSDGYENFLTLAPGDEYTCEAYVFCSVPKWENYGMATLIDRLCRIFPFRHKACMDYKTARRAAYAQIEAHTVRLFNGAYMVKNALRDCPDKDGQYMPYEVYECGWSGQCCGSVRHYIEKWKRNGELKYLEMGLSSLDAWCESQLDNGLLQKNYIRSVTNVRKFPADVCNLGWFAHELMLAWNSLKDTEYARPKYLECAEKTLRFLIDNYSEEDAFGLEWNMDGTKASTGGSAGGFVLMALCLAYKLTGKEEYLEYAIKTDEFYYKRDISDFCVTAGALDCRCVDKESAYPFAVAALDLYDITGDKKYLERAEMVAYYFASWMFFFDTQYAEKTQFEDLGYYTSGGTAVSAQHHAIDPWGVAIIPECLRLARELDKPIWRDIAYRYWCNAILAINLDEDSLWLGHHRPWGMQSEAYFQCRWVRSRYNFAPRERARINDVYGNWNASFRLTTIDKVLALEGNADFFK